MDGVDVFEGVWVIAATSRPDLIDQALLRPGRIGVKLHCQIPTTVIIVTLTTSNSIIFCILCMINLIWEKNLLNEYV